MTGNGFDAGDRFLQFGLPGDQPVSGDWNKDGKDTPGVLQNRKWFFDLEGDGYTGEVGQPTQIGLGGIAVSGSSSSARARQFRCVQVVLRVLAPLSPNHLQQNHLQNHLQQNHLAAIRLRSVRRLFDRLRILRNHQFKSLRLRSMLKELFRGKLQPSRSAP